MTVSSMSAECGAQGRLRAARLWLGVAVALYLAAAAWLIYVTRNRINPDAISYIQSARNYAAGRFDLAINGWFGPMLSWLTIPAVWLGVRPILFIRAMFVVVGILFAAGAGRLTSRMTGGRYGWLAFACGLILSLRAVGDEMTPDLLLACGLTWYFVAAHRLILAGGPRRAFAAGLLGGACYYIKGYALVFVAAHLVMTLALRLLMARRGRAAGGALKALPAGLAGLLLAAAPWIAAISVHSGRPCIATLGRSVQSWGPLPVSGPLPVHMLQRPRAGRITGWENPVEIPYAWPEWQSAGPADYLTKLARVVWLNIIDALRHAARFDLFALLLIGWAVASVVCCLPGQRLSSGAAAGRAWACLSVALFVGGLLPLWVVHRYLRPTWGLAVPIFASLLCLFEARAGRRSRDSLDAEAKTRSARRATGLLAVVLLLSIFARLELSAFMDQEGPVTAGRRATWLRELASDMKLQGQIASNDWYGGLFASYWAGAPFLGQLEGDDPWAMAEELRPYGKTTVLYFCGSRWWVPWVWNDMGWDRARRRMAVEPRPYWFLDYVRDSLGLRREPRHYVGEAWNDVLVLEIDPNSMPPKQTDGVIPWDLLFAPEGGQ